ncbi:putative glycoside hydrolase, partial [bacterium]|nr:putative glycoside hydrolase [bacterium]
MEEIHNKKKYRGMIALFSFLGAGGILLASAGGAFLATDSYISPSFMEALSSATSTAGEERPVRKESKPPPFAVTHIPTPEPVKALYMSQCAAGTPSFRAHFLDLIKKTEINAVVIDIKDYTGKIAFKPKNPELLGAYETAECAARDMKEYIGSLHNEGVYVIGRITVFQDPHYTKLHPELSVQKASDRSTWKDYKGLSFVDVGAEEFWHYIAALAHEAHEIGFDELNFDYIRYPSDGNMKDIYYPVSQERLIGNPNTGKADVLRDFFSYLHGEFAPAGVPISADLFGMTMTNSDDLNIGQILEYAA